MEKLEKVIKALEHEVARTELEWLACEEAAAVVARKGESNEGL